MAALVDRNREKRIFQIRTVRAEKLTVTWAHLKNSKSYLQTQSKSKRKKIKAQLKLLCKHKDPILRLQSRCDFRFRMTANRRFLLCFIIATPLGPTEMQ